MKKSLLPAVILFLAYGLLWLRHPAIGVALCALSAFGWIASAGDVATVYPFAHHLGRFVRSFRARYRAQRGRL